MLKRILFLSLGKHFQANTTFSATSLVICLGAALKKSVRWIGLKLAVRCAALMGKATTLYNFDGADTSRHRARDCEDRPPPRPGKECRVCQSTEHQAKDCPNGGEHDCFQIASHSANLRLEKRTCRNCMSSPPFPFLLLLTQRRWIRGPHRQGM